MLNDRVLPFYDNQDIDLLRILKKLVLLPINILVIFLSKMNPSKHIQIETLFHILKSINFHQIGILKNLLEEH